jgi:hypothetical protein
VLRAAAIAALVIALRPASGGAQIVRDSIRPATPALPAARPAPRPASVPGVPDPDSAARAAQEGFEKFRRYNLNHVLPSLPRKCDEQVGRLCYWYDESTTLPRERDTVSAMRTRLLSTLDSLAKKSPEDIWITEQRVRYLIEAARNDEALAVAKSCERAQWRCDALRGLAHHVKEQYVEAEKSFDAALAQMGAKQRCEWRTIYLLLDDVALGAYRDIPCGDPRRDAWEARTWFLARTLYSMPGNDSRSEFFARMTMIHLLADAAVAYQFGFDESERELLLRFGWPRAWAAVTQLPVQLALTTTPAGTPPPVTPGGAKGRGRGGTPVGSYPPGTKIPKSVPPLERPPDMPGGRGLPGGLGGMPEARPGFGLPKMPSLEVSLPDGDGVNVLSIEAVPAYRYIPAGFVLEDPTQSDSAAWRIHLPPVWARYAPPYAKVIDPLEHQKAVFRRGDSALVVMSYDATRSPSMTGKLRAGLVVTSGGRPAAQFETIRDNAPSQSVLTVKAPFGPLLMSAEVAAPEKKAIARARYGVGPMRGPALRVSLSDLLFFKPFGKAPESAEEAAPHALPTERVRAREKLGVYWEAYGTNPSSEQMKVSLVVLRENPNDEPGFLRRMMGARGTTPVSVSVQDLSARDRSMSPRAIELDISTLTRGAYIVQLEIEVAGQPTLRAEHRIEVTGP